MPTYLVPTLWLSALGISGLTVTTLTPGGGRLLADYRDLEVETA